MENAPSRPTLRCGSRALGMSVQFWLNAQLIVDLYDAQHSPDAKKIAKIKPLVKIPA
jgi:plasmid maintenance system antidote protein VapI